MAELEPLVGPLGETTLPTPEIAAELLEQITEYFKNLVDLSKLDQYLGVVFPESKGLISFLGNSKWDKKYNKSKEAALDLIRWTVSRVDKSWREGVVPYAERLRTVLVKYISTNEVSRNQQIALDALISLYEKYAEHLGQCSELYWALLPNSEKSAYQPSVRGKMLHCLGLIASVSADSKSNFMTQDNFNQLFKHIIASVQSQVESRDTPLEVTILHGCLRAMDRILKSFKDRLMPTKDSNKLFQQFSVNLEQIINPECSIAPQSSDASSRNKNQLKRREFQRAGLELIANNPDYFSHQFYTNYKQWYGDLITWAKSNNSDDNYAGRKAMFKFLETISTYAKTFNKSNDDEELMETNDTDDLVEFFLNTFHAILNAKNSNRSELLVAIKGIGWISTSSSNSSRIKIVFDTLMTHVENIIVELSNPVMDKYSGSLSLISTYLESIGGIIPQIESSNDHVFLSQLDSIETLTIHLTTYFPDLSERVRMYAHLSLLKLVKGLQLGHQDVCIPFLDRVINASLSHLIASPTQAELDILFEAWNKSNQSSSSKKSPKSQLGLRGIKSYTQFWINSASSNDNSACLIYDRVMHWILATIERLDLTLLIDTTDELQTFGNGDIFSSIKAVAAKDFHLFVNLVEFFQEFVQKTVDGGNRWFSKWAEVLMVDFLKLIEENPLVSGFYKMLATALDSCRKIAYFKHIDSDAKQSVLDMCNKFMSSLPGKICQFRDDLLVSVLELWLSAPDEIIILNFNSLNQTLKTVFSIGRSCLSLAEKCTTALDRWILMDQFLLREDIETLVKSLYPVWRTYFVSAGNDEEIIQDSKRQKTTISSKNASHIYRDEKRLKRMAEELNDATLLKVQLNLLNIIGSFAHLLELGTENEENHKNNKVMSAGKTFLKYAIPFSDMRPDIYFDTLVPRLIELCENSADRQTKTSASEMFHTVILYFLGYDANKSSGTAAQRNTEDLFMQIYRCVMKLACDSDVLIRQLFNPLAIQSIRWFTQCQSSYAEIILALIFEGLTQQEDLGDQRDFAGACLCEYFVWSLKHDKSNQKLLAKSILDQLCVLSTHAVIQYRFGAIVGFNGLYKEFREDPDLKNAYTIILLTSFITSLSLSVASVTEEDSVILKSTKLAIAHVERILMKKKDSFNHAIGSRKRPLDIPSTIPVLKDVVEWLMIQIAQQPNPLVRDECLRLVKVISPAVTGCGSMNNFLKSYALKLEETQLISIAEKSLKDSVDNQSSHEKILQSLTSAAAFYSLLISETQHIVPDILNSARTSIFISTYKRVMQQYINQRNCSQGEIQGLLMIFYYYEQLKTLFSKLDHKLYIQVSSLLLQQHVTHGFMSKEQLEAIAASWLNLGSLSEESKYHLKSLVDLDISKFSLSSIEGKKYLEWLFLLVKSSVLNRILNQNMIAQLLEAVWSALKTSIYNSPSGLSKNMNFCCGLLFQIYLTLAGDEDTIVSCTFDQTLLSSTLPSAPQTKGQLFMDVLLDVLLQCSKLRRFEELIKTVRIPAVGILIERFLSLLKRNRSLRKTYGEEIFANVTQIWTSLSVNCDPYTVARILRGLAAIDFFTCRDSDYLANWWSGPDMMTAVHLNLKQKAEFIGFLGLFGLSQKNTIATRVINSTMSLVNKDILVEKMTYSDEEGHLTKVIQQLISVYENRTYHWQLLETLVLCLGKCLTIHKNSVKNETTNSNSLPSVFLTVKRRLLKVIKTMINSKNTNHQYLLASTICKTLLNNPDCHNHLLVSKLYLIPVLAALELTPGKNFFQHFVFSSIERINSLKSLTVLDLNLKTISFNIIEMMAHKCGPKYIKDELNQEYLKYLVTDKKMTKEAIEAKKLTLLRALTEACIAFKRSGLQLSHMSNQCEEIRRAQFSCNAASYNAAAATLLSASSKANALEGFLVHEDRKRNFLWENIIDQSFQYQFPVVFSQSVLPGYEVNEKILSFAKDSTTFIDGTEIGDDNKRVENAALLSNRLNLGESSLAVEATDYDFTASVNVSTTDFYKKIFGQNASLSPKDFSTKEPDNPIPYVSVVSSQLNLQDCMLPFVATLKRLSELSKEHESTPNWVTYLQKVLKENHHLNIKLFIIGAFMNCSEDIQPYASNFLKPILKLFVDEDQNEFLGHDKLNYFVKDVIVMLLSWKDSYIPQADINSSTDLRKKLMQFLIQHSAYYEQSNMREDVVEHNLNLIQNVITIWSIETEELPTDVIMAYFAETEKVKLALGLCKNILKAGKLPHNNPEKLMKEFAKCLKSSSKPVYAGAGENMGLLLQFLRKSNYESIEEARKSAKTSISSEKSRLSIFLTILQNLSMDSPEDLPLFKSAIFELINVSSVSDQVYALLPVLLGQELSGKEKKDAAKEATVFYADLEGRRVFKLFTSPVSCITLLEIFVERMTDYTKLMKILGWLKPIESLPSTDYNLKLLARYGSCALKIFKLIQDISPVESISLWGPHEKKLCRVFLRFFANVDPDIVNISEQFWSIALEKENDASRMMLELLKLIGNEQSALEIIVSLVLKRCCQSPEFSKDIFDGPLSDCHYYAHNLDTSWRMRHASFQPMFAESLSSSQNFATLPKAIQSTILSQRQNIGAFGVNLLRATLSVLEFTPTHNQQVGSRGDSIETSMMIGDSMSENEFQFLQQRDSLPLSNTDSGQTSQTSSNPQDPLAGLRKRFYTRTPSSTGYFAAREMEKQSSKFNMVVEKVRSARNNVKLTRSYRVGDLPDIAIKHSDLLNTLIRLCSLDEATARRIFLLLFTSICEELKIRPKQGFSKSYDFCLFLSQAKDAFETVLSTFGRTLDSQFVAGIMEICIINEIRLKPSVISSICEEFDLQELGIIALEKWFEPEDNNTALHPPSTKRPRTEAFTLSATDELSVWLGIAEFYKEMEDFDSLQNIFTLASYKSEGSCREDFNKVKEALAEDAAGDVDEACAKYLSLCRETHYQNQSFKKFLEDALMMSYMKLSNWDSLFEVTRGHQNKILSNNADEQKDYLTRIFPWKIKAGLQVYLGNRESELNLTIERLIMTDGKLEAKFLAEMTQLTQANYPIEVAIMTTSSDLFQATGKAALLLDKAWQIGLKNFSVLPKLPQPVQEERILLLQQSASLQDVIFWSKNLSVGNLSTKASTFVTKTNRLVGYPMAPLVNCDIIVTQRNHFIQQIVETCERNANTDGGLQFSDTISSLHQLNLNQHLWLLSLGIRDRNIDISNKYLDKAKLIAEQSSGNSSGREMVLWRKMYVKYLTTFQKETTDNWLTMWASAYKKVSRAIANTRQDGSNSDSIQMKGELLTSLIHYMKHNERQPATSVKKKVISVICENRSSQGRDIEEIAKTESKSFIENLISNPIADEGHQSDSWCEAYKQLHLLLKLLLDEYPVQYGEDEQIMSLSIKTLLRSIDPLSKDGCLLFPTILTVLEKHESAHQTFVHEIQRVPTWIFLPWLDQIISSYRSNTRTQSLLQPLMTRLTTEYHNAFEMQYPEYLPPNSSSSHFKKKYTQAVKTLVLPEILHKDAFEKTMMLLGSRSFSKDTATAAVAVFSDFKQYLVKIRDNEDGLFGELHTSFARDVLNIIDAPAFPAISLTEMRTEPTSQNVYGFSDTDSRGRLNDCVRDHKLKLNRKAYLPTKEFSPWLANFHHAYNRDEVELPGHYDSLDKVNVSFIPQLVSFRPHVTLLSSLTKPLRVTLIGNNGKQYNFLVKYGDDLRQDRRIQQLLRISNKIFDSDCRTKNKKFQLVTYSVIPMSDNFGVTEWVDSTMPLKSFILSNESLIEDYKKSLSIHVKWIESSSGLNTSKRNMTESYLENIKSVGRDAAESHMKRMTDPSSGGLPGNLLVSAVMSRTSHCPEKFFRVRQHLIRSYATMCTVHWLLGIGDRHLENTLVSLESGSFVGIDFGRSFGTGNTLLPVPELVPFRLTKQMTALMMPYGPTGLFKQSMLHSLRVLLASSSIFSAVIDIFVNEYSINWLEDRKRKSGSNNQSPADDDIQVLSTSVIQPMEIVKKKFQCTHPLSILLEEIASNRYCNIRQPYKKFLERDRSADLSSLNSHLTPEETVDYLISLASDASLLARLYFGWSAWV